MSEEVFWHCDMGFLKEVAACKGAYDGWMQAEKETAMEEARKSHGIGKERG